MSNDTSPDTPINGGEHQSRLSPRLKRSEDGSLMFSQNVSMTRKAKDAIKASVELLAAKGRYDLAAILLKACGPKLASQLGTEIFKERFETNPSWAADFLFRATMEGVKFGDEFIMASVEWLYPIEVTDLLEACGPKLASQLGTEIFKEHFETDPSWAAHFVRFAVERGLKFGDEFIKASVKRLFEAGYRIEATDLLEVCGPERASRLATEIFTELLEAESPLAADFVHATVEGDFNFGDDVIQSAVRQFFEQGDDYEVAWLLYRLDQDRAEAIVTAVVTSYVEQEDFESAAEFLAIHEGNFATRSPEVISQNLAKYPALIYVLNRLQTHGTSPDTSQGTATVAGARDRSPMGCAYIADDREMRSDGVERSTEPSTEPGTKPSTEPDIDSLGRGGLQQ